MFEVGDTIVYPIHGVGTIEGIEKKTILGKRNEFYIISIMSSGMKVMVPVKTAEDKIGIRGIIPKKNVNKVIDVLVKENVKLEEDWKLRYQQNLEKIKSGDIFRVAEVTRDLYRRGQEKELSIMERKLYENAYQLLTNELSKVRKTDVEEAGNFVSEALASVKKSGE